MTRATLAALTLTALVAWAVLRRQPMPRAELTRREDDDGIQPPDPGLVELGDRMTGWDYLNLDPSFDGSCPCAAFEVEGVKFEAHCWRLCERCEYAGLHYEEPVVRPRNAEVILQVLGAFQAMGWSEWTLRHGMERTA